MVSLGSVFIDSNIWKRREKWYMYIQEQSSRSVITLTLRPDFMSKLVHGLAFGTPKFYIAPYDKINHGLINLGYNCDVKSCFKVPHMKRLNLQTA